MSTLQGRTALVTGGSKGIGAAIAAALAEAGAAVAVNYAGDAQAAATVVDKINAAGGRAAAVQADVSRPDDVVRMFAEAREHLGPVNILVNNAGVYSFAPFEAVTPDEFHRQVDTNLLAPLLTMQEFAKQPEADGGAIINLSTAGTTSHPPYSALYTATKSAVNSATTVISKELAGRGIRVNAIAPTASDTEGTRNMGFVGSPAGEQAASQIPFGRLGRPEDIAPIAVFLASAGAGWITGEVVFASGGDR